MVTIDFTDLGEMCAQCRDRRINEGLSALAPFLRAKKTHDEEMTGPGREIQEGLTHLVNQPKPDAEAP